MKCSHGFAVLALVVGFFSGSAIAGNGIGLHAAQCNAVVRVRAAKKRRCLTLSTKINTVSVSAIKADVVIFTTLQMLSRMKIHLKKFSA